MKTISRTLIAAAILATLSFNLQAATVKPSMVDTGKMSKMDKKMDKKMSKKMAPKKMAKDTGKMKKMSKM
ncbi:hypothetical protein ACFS5N_09770 [Mucilaginibacter ximonensis]|uniref:Pentapeptide MXKDX repeat protein n=1 Tax=Mucilaginibacter ximonensis TaxID=538021 RepID=A0ABW5YBV3_9SPHI